MFSQRLTQRRTSGKQRCKDKGEQQGDARAHQQRIVIGQGIEHRLGGAEACHIKPHDDERGNNVRDNTPRDFHQIGRVMRDDDKRRPARRPPAGSGCPEGEYRPGSAHH